MKTRDKILDAATSMVQEGQDERLTVRAVAARAGVGMGTLRHYFPTQRSLLDAVLASMYDSAMPDDHIHDITLPPQQRLVDNLGKLVSSIGIGDEARVRWGELYRNYVSPEARDDIRKSYVSFDAQATRRIEAWLAILVEQGALEPGDNTTRADFLLSVVNGLAVRRALPNSESALTREIDSLRLATNALRFSQH